MKIFIQAIDKGKAASEKHMRLNSDSHAHMLSLLTHIVVALLTVHVSVMFMKAEHSIARKLLDHGRDAHCSALGIIKDNQAACLLHTVCVMLNLMLGTTQPYLYVYRSLTKTITQATP